MHLIRELGVIAREKRYHLLGAIIFVFLIPFPQKLVSGAIILWVILSLISLRRQHINFRWPLLLLPALYVTYVLAMGVNGNLSTHVLEHKLSLLIFPLIFILHPYKRGDRILLLKTFMAGLVFSGIVCIIYALFRSIEPVEMGYEFRANVLEERGFIESIRYGGNYLFGRYFSVFHQTVYYAMYISLGVAILLFQESLFKMRQRFLILGFLLLLLFLIANKAAFLVLLFLFVFHISTRKISREKKVQFLSVFIIISGVFAWANPRIKDSIKTAFLNDWVLDKNARYGFETRLLSWDAAIELIKTKPVLGSGAGNSQDNLDAVYKAKGYKYPRLEKLNAHNQFLQIWLENGIAGLLIWIGIFIALFKGIYRTVHFRHLYFAVVMILLFNSLFESVLNRFSGISFVAFVVCFILSNIKGEEPS